ncbi:MAG: M15 family metallopeptidase [Bacillaceae bacterium]|nr:M15 family metallopeptidase [Bacillaceae bacterium]
MSKHTEILMSDPKIAAIPVKGTHEPFVNLVDYDPDIFIDKSQSQIASNSPFFSYVRRSVAEKLVAAKAYLPKGVHFYVKEGYRPAEVQVQAFNETYQELKKSFSNMSQENLIAMASKYVAPIEVAPHPTGGALDVTLITSDGKELDLGTPFNASPNDTENATYLQAINISNKARENRKILSYSLQAAGFVNYFTEWWHWSFGDRYWALMKNESSSIYQPVSEQELKKLVE